MSDFTGKGYLARNGRKEPGSQQPDLRGKLNIGGTEFELAGWEKEKDGRQYVSLTVQPARDSNRPATRSTPAGRGDTAERNSARLLRVLGPRERLRPEDFTMEKFRNFYQRKQ